MTTVEKDDGSFYGLGIENDFDSFKQEIWEHNGGTLGYSSWMVWIKNSDIVIAIIISDTTKDRNDIDCLLIDLVNFLTRDDQNSSPSVLLPRMD